MRHGPCPIPRIPRADASPCELVCLLTSISPDQNESIPERSPAVSLGHGRPGKLYDAGMTHEMKGWLFLMASLLLLWVICGLAMLGLLTRPARWVEREGQRSTAIFAVQ